MSEHTRADHRYVWNCLTMDISKIIYLLCHFKYIYNFTTLLEDLFKVQKVIVQFLYLRDLIKTVMKKKYLVEREGNNQIMMLNL